MSRSRSPLVADTGGLLRALARRPDGKPTWPDYERALLGASRVIVPALILAEMDTFLKDDRPAMRRFVAELFDPETTYHYEATEVTDLARALELDLKFAGLALGLVDGVVAAVAERLRIHRILTIDREDLGPLRVGRNYQVSFDLVP